MGLKFVQSIRVKTRKKVFFTVCTLLSSGRLSTPRYSKSTMYGQCVRALLIWIVRSRQRHLAAFSEPHTVFLTSGVSVLSASAAFADSWSSKKRPPNVALTGHWKWKPFGTQSGLIFDPPGTVIWESCLLHGGGSLWLSPIRANKRPAQWQRQNCCTARKKNIDVML